MTIRTLLAGAAVALAASPALAEAPEGWAPLLEPTELASILDRTAEDEVRYSRSTRTTRTATFPARSAPPMPSGVARRRTPAPCRILPGSMR